MLINSLLGKAMSRKKEDGEWFKGEVGTGSKETASFLSKVRLTVVKLKSFHLRDECSLPRTFPIIPNSTKQYQPKSELLPKEIRWLETTKHIRMGYAEQEGK